MFVNDRDEQTGYSHLYFHPRDVADTNTAKDLTEQQTATNCTLDIAVSYLLLETFGMGRTESHPISVTSVVKSELTMVGQMMLFA